MKKEVKMLVNEKVSGYYLDWSWVSIDKIIEDLLKLEEMGATHINIDTEDEWGTVH